MVTRTAVAITTFFLQVHEHSSRAGGTPESANSVPTLNDYGYSCALRRICLVTTLATATIEITICLLIVSLRDATITTHLAEGFPPTLPF